MEESSCLGFENLPAFGKVSKTRAFWSDFTTSVGGEVPANFAEGFKKLGKADKLRFYNIAQGSLEECRYYLILTRDLNYGEVKDLQNEAEVISKMLNAYMQAIAKDR